MAKNYQIGEAVAIIAEGKDNEAIADLGRRYPLLTAKIAKATAGENKDDVVELFKYFPDYDSANKINRKMKAVLLDGVEPADDDDDGDEDEAPAKKPAPKKAPVKKAPAKKAAAKKDDNPYEGMSPVDLFKECKKKGIKAEAKKSAKYYIDLLTKAEADDGDDDWDDEEEAKPAKKAPAKKPAAKKPAKKAEPVEDDDDDDDDDDDWDI